MVLNEGMIAVHDDVDEVFRFDKQVRPQDRAHAYLARNRVVRDYSDTAMQRVAHDLCDRAFAAGMACAPVRAMDDRVGRAAEMLLEAAALLDEVMAE